MKPYYKDEWVTIYNSDSIELCQDLSGFDCVLTDPPYGVGERTGGIGKTRKHLHDYGEHIDTEDFVVNKVVPLIAHLSSKAPVAITPGAKNVWSFPKPASLGAFFHPAASSLQHWGFRDLDPILFYGRDPRVGTTISKCTYTLTEPPPKNGHPCPRPIKAWGWLLEKVSLHNQTVLDPFGGSGTTGLVAKERGRKAILIELEERYCEIAAKRMQQEYMVFE